MIGSMSSGGVDDHWDEIVERVREIGKRHPHDKGIVHTVSYDRAERLHKALPQLTMYHDQKKDLTSAGWITKWQQSDKQIFLTPSMTEGVDLKGDLCRFQILLKVPYRNIGDARVDYLLNEENEWEWYHDTAAREIIQSIGRAVRSKDDHATYYVLDSKFDQAMNGRTPDWLEEAIVR
jgi:Rad3-related DNA helicase